jgi:hypothetical protein
MFEVHYNEAMAAIGRPGSTEDLPEQFQKRETPSDRRLVNKSICAGPFQFD